MRKSNSLCYHILLWSLDQLRQRNNQNETFRSALSDVPLRSLHFGGKLQLYYISLVYRSIDTVCVTGR